MLPFLFICNVERTWPKSLIFSGELLLNKSSETLMELAPDSSNLWQTSKHLALVLENWNDPVSETIPQ